MATLVEVVAEAYRLCLLAGLEELLAEAGFSRIAGVDEAGRGCLAGPVVAAAVVVDPQRIVPGVDDSKALSGAQRERLAGEIRRASLASVVAGASADMVDRMNILEATRLVMRQALISLQPPADCAVIDAVSLPEMPLPCLSVVRGDSLSYAVAAASVLAKVERDRMMVELDRQYPQYGFAAHKGYAARQHREALAKYGPCPVHRLTFRSVLPRRQERVC
jgi:ribonuclease HII